MRLLNRLTIIHPLTLPGPLEKHTSTADKYSLRLRLQHESTSSFYLPLSYTHTHPLISLTLLPSHFPLTEPPIFFSKQQEDESVKDKEKDGGREKERDREGGHNCV